MDDAATAVADSFTYGLGTATRAVMRLLRRTASSGKMAAAVAVEQDQADLEVDSYLVWLAEQPDGGLSEMDQAVFAAIGRAKLDSLSPIIELEALFGPAELDDSDVQMLLSSIKVLEEKGLLEGQYAMGSRLPWGVRVDSRALIDRVASSEPWYSTAFDRVRRAIAQREWVHFDPQSFELESGVPAAVSVAILDVLRAQIELEPFTGGDFLVRCTSETMLRWASTV